MALFNECMPQCAQKVFDTADIVRDGILRQLWSPTQANIFRNCSILNRRSIASVGMISASRLRGRAVQQTSQLERVWGVLFWGEGIQSGLTNPLWHYLDAPHFQEMCNVEQTPNTAWCKLA